MSDHHRRPWWPLVTRKDLELLERLIMLTKKELADGLVALQTQVGKVATEQATRFDALTAKVAELEEALKNADDVGEEVTTAFAGVQTALQALDDTIPDAPPPAP